jgi:hypothetical protein
VAHKFARFPKVGSTPFEDRGDHLSADWAADERPPRVPDTDARVVISRQVDFRTKKPRGVIYVVSSHDRLHHLKRCLSSIEEHFNSHRSHRYPVWVFASGLTHRDTLELRELSSAWIKIVKLDTPIRPGPPEGRCGLRADPATTKLLVSDIPLLLARRYDWQLRIADTTFFKADLETDVFR